MLHANKFNDRCCVCDRLVPIATGTWSDKAERRANGKTRVWCGQHRTEAEDADRTGRLMPDTHPGQSPPDNVSPQDVDVLVAQIARLTTEYATQDIAAALARVPELVKAEFAALAPRELVIKPPKPAPKVTIKQYHVMLPTILEAVGAGSSPLIVGPAGSGKTTLAKQVATTLGRMFFMAARVTSEFKLTGFIDATGKCVRTQFREAYEHGGVFLFDEIDASDPDALTTFNAGLAGEECDFPDGMVKRHKDFIAIAAGNTYGRGADRMYVGRNQLDAATLDRFEVFDVDYDENLERALAGDSQWVDYVQRVRRAVEYEKVRHIVSPRASIRGAAMLARGMDRAVVENATVWKGMAPETRTRIETRMVSV